MNWSYITIVGETYCFFYYSPNVYLKFVDEIDQPWKSTNVSAPIVYHEQFYKQNCAQLYTHLVATPNFNALPVRSV